MRLSCRTRAALGLASIWPVFSLHGEIRLPSLISDGMVLQRDAKVNFWGTADSGEHVFVKLNGAQAATVVDGTGQWRLQLGPLSAGGPFAVTITGKNHITLHNVFVGEVWVCSGQSNMGMTVGPTRPPFYTGVNNFQDELNHADYPMLHLFTVEKTVAGKPQRNVKGNWLTARPETVNDFSAVGYFFGRELLKNIGVPIGMIHASLGSTTAETWTPKEVLASNPELKSIVDADRTVSDDYRNVFERFEYQFTHWKQASEMAERAGDPVPQPPKVPDDPRQNPNRPGALYNGMIAPITPYVIKGVVWYQGESNTDRPAQYAVLFPELIRSWRHAWGQGDFPFLFVQLTSWGIRYPYLLFPELREAQSKALEIPNTAMVITTDIGDGMDGHPKNKQDVAYRLALAAQAIAYGRDVIYLGPTYDSMKVEDHSVRVFFKHVYGRLTYRNWPPGNRNGFEIAGTDQVFFPAEVSIDGETVLLHSDKVPQPVAVRYNWDINPWYNLYNLAGLPAAPFRTHPWPSAASPR
jgi:sialate O-acetylesterase